MPCKSIKEFIIIMRIAIYSDLHLEFEPWTPPTNLNCDIVVLAGDIHIGDAGLKWASEHFDMPIIYVPGNHEFYDAELHATYELLRQTSQDLGIHLLVNNTIEIGDLYFIGATLWTDFGLLGNPIEAAYNAKRKMEDFKSIKIAINEQVRNLQPEDTINMHRQSVSFIEKSIEFNKGKRIVVVTHHSPSNNSTPPVYKGDYLSPAFSSELDSLVADENILMWIHGHTHHCVDYFLEKTRIVSNQRGYKPFETILNFSENFIVEI
jgi:Icc-related predicted phosphoesterase